MNHDHDHHADLDRGEGLHGAGNAGQPEPTSHTLRSLPKVRLYAKSAAMTIELDAMKPDKDRGGLIYPGRDTWTLRIELANVQPSSGGRRYDWSNKISLQLTPSELPVFVSTIMGWSKDCAFTNHGTARNKSLRVENQDGKIYFDIREGMAGAALPVPDQERYGMGMLCAVTLQRNHPETGAQLALNMIKQLYGRS